MGPSSEELISIANEFINIMDEEIIGNKHKSINGIRRIGGLLIGSLPETTRIAVIGDIHGDYMSFRKILSEVKGADIIIFLGDYIDRGPPDGQIQTIYDLMRMYVEGAQIIALRGNHEPPRELIPYPHDFPMILRLVYGGEGLKVYNLLFNAWNKMPHALVIKGHALMVHGGPPTIGLDKTVEEYFGGVNPQLSLLEEILWNDPIDEDIVRRPNPRGAGSLWGFPVTSIALDKARARMIIRGHEATITGYKWNHDGRVLTLFSRLGPPYYNEKAAYLSCVLHNINAYEEGCIHTFS